MLQLTLQGAAACTSQSSRHQGLVEVALAKAVSGLNSYRLMLAKQLSLPCSSVFQMSKNIVRRPLCNTWHPSESSQPRHNAMETQTSS